MIIFLLSLLSCRYLWIGSNGQFFCGVQCNGGSSSSAIGTSTISAPNTDYLVECRYDGTTAALWLNGQKEKTEAKTFNYVKTIDRITIGRGDLSGSSENYDFGYEIFCSFFFFLIGRLSRLSLSSLVVYRLSCLSCLSCVSIIVASYIHALGD